MHATAATTIPWYYLPQFRPVRLQDCVFWLESDSFNGGIWRNLIPNSANTSHGTAHGAVGLSTWHPQFAPALEFHAGDDYIDLPLDIVFDDEMSIEIVFEFYDRTDGGRLIGSQGDNDKEEIRTYVTAPPTSLGLIVGNGNNYASVYEYIDFFEKYHFIWTWKYDSGADETTLKGYKNGNFFKSTTFDDKVFLPKYNLRVAHWVAYGMKGKIYLARFYHKVLSEDEIRHNYTHHPIYYLQHGIDPYQVIAAATAAAAPSI